MVAAQPCPVSFLCDLTCMFCGTLERHRKDVELACVLLQDTWRNAKYSMQMLVSTSEAMQRCWKATDALFDGISDWSVQPIDVRHPFGFYYGHLASFAKLKTMPRVSNSKHEIDPHSDAA